MISNGDIIIWKKKGAPDLIHCGMEFNGKVIEALPGRGVNLNPYFPRLRGKVWDTVEMYYVKDATYEERKHACAWAISQRWKKYQLWWRFNKANWNPYDSSDCKSNEFYCSELIWAAYMNATNGKLNISDAPYINDSKYGFVHVYSLLKSGKLIKYDG